MLKHIWGIIGIAIGIGCIGNLRDEQQASEEQFVRKLKDDHGGSYRDRLSLHR